MSGVFNNVLSERVMSGTASHVYKVGPLVMEKFEWQSVLVMICEH